MFVAVFGRLVAFRHLDFRAEFSALFGVVGIPVASCVLVVKAPFSGGSTALRLCDSYRAPGQEGRRRHNLLHGVARDHAKAAAHGGQPEHGADPARTKDTQEQDREQSESTFLAVIDQVGTRLKSNTRLSEHYEALSW